MHFANIVNDFDRTGANAVTNRTPFGDDFTLRMQRVTLHDLAARTHGFWTRLHDKQLAGVSVFRPFDIHRTAIVLLNLHRLFRQLLHVVITERETVALLLRHIFNLNLFTVFKIRRINHADFFGTHRTTNDRGAIRRQRRFVYIEFVRVNRALHHHLTQPPGGCDKDHLIETGFGINREHHAGSANIGAHHALHARRERDATVIVALMHAIGDGAIVEQRSKDVFHRDQHGVIPLHVEESFLLTGKGGVRHIFCGGR
ncbi:hypothetical protein D3C78_1093070 [compost metagenome]